MAITTNTTGISGGGGALNPPTIQGPPSIFAPDAFTDPRSGARGATGGTTGIAGGGAIAPSGGGTDFSAPFKLNDSAQRPWTDENTFKYALANDVGYNADAFANQQLNLYERGQLPKGTQDAIDLAQTTSLGALSGQLAAEGLDPQTSSQYSAGAATIATEKSIQTQLALEKVLQNYFQASGLTLQADQLVGQFTEFDQELQLQYFQIAVQQQEFSSQQKKQAAGQAGGALSGLFSAGGKVVLLGAMAALHQIMEFA